MNEPAQSSAGLPVLRTGWASGLARMSVGVLRRYLAWKRGDPARAEHLRQDTRQALGKDWQPKGATWEGDARRKQHAEKSPLARYWESWDGVAEPARTYADLDARLRSGR